MLQLANRSIVYPEGVIEDVLLQIRQFILPAGLIILDYEADEQAPIILGQPLLATADTVINVREVKMILRVDNVEAIFNVYREIQLPRHNEDLAMISVIEKEEKKNNVGAYLDDSLEKELMLFGNIDLDDEVKQMEEKLLRVLREHKRAIGWTMANISGISPTFFMHKILMHDGHKPSVEHQCRLNPIMKEVVRKEFIKWLDAGIIFPISDSKWDKEKTTFTCPYGTYAFKRMLFGLCNAPVTFQRCMMAIFTNIVEKFVEVFMDDFSVFGPTFDECLTNMSKVLARCEETNLVLNWEKCHFMVSIVDSLKISTPGLLEKDAPFKFDEHCLKPYEELKRRLEFDVEIKYRKGTENQAGDHLSRLETRAHIEEGDEIGVIPSELSPDGKRKFIHDVILYLWDESFLFNQCADQLVRRCVPEEEMEAILHDCHASTYGRHHGGDKTAAKVLQSGFYWSKLLKDAHAFVKRCDRCQRTGTTSRRHEMPLKGILEVEIFDVWGIDFLGPFPASNVHRYILVAVDYASKWVEVVALPTNDANVVVNFVKKNNSPDSGLRVF
ncbi:uncharacterized protein [Nicotiana tomentosiformis]|uniref:uncharacterized protein n=1 Tax=Nicotiana tomentosiformis TaxID=4098 RepID=UPI00388C9188